MVNQDNEALEMVRDHRGVDDKHVHAGTVFIGPAHGLRRCIESEGAGPGPRWHLPFNAGDKLFAIAVASAEVWCNRD
jgi:hypothetical protein